jgi:transposase-like protein
LGDRGRKDGFHHLNNGRKVQRYLCTTCRKSFCNKSFSLAY